MFIHIHKSVKNSHFPSNSEPFEFLSVKMASFKLCILILVLSILASGTPLNVTNSTTVGDQITSASEVKVVIPPDSTTKSKGDLKTSNSFGLGYYLPIVSPTLVKYHYHYPLLYYNYPTAYLQSIRHHGYGGIGYYHHGVNVIH